MAAKAKDVQAVWQNLGDWAESKSEKFMDRLHVQRQKSMRLRTQQVIWLLLVGEGTRSKRKMFNKSSPS